MANFCRTSRGILSEWLLTLFFCKGSRVNALTVFRNGLHSNTLNALQRQDFLNPFPNKPWFLRVCPTSLLKTL